MAAELPARQQYEHAAGGLQEGDLKTNTSTATLFEDEGHPAYKLRFLAIAWFLILLKGMMIPSIPYIINTFFAASHGGGDCEVEPDSKPCQRGATDAATWQSCSEAVSNTVAMLMAVTLGSCSDRLGRLPVLQASTTLSALVLTCLAMHVFLGWSLWMFLVATTMYEAFDANGVIIAMVLDVPNMIPDADERRSAWQGLGLAMVPLMACKVVISTFIPEQYGMTVSVVGAWLHFLYMLLYFPETASMSKPQHNLGPSMVLRDLRRIFGRNGFIRRIAIAIAVLGFAGAGCSVIFPPFMTGRLGVKKVDRLLLFAAVGPAVAAWFAMLGRLQSSIGDVGVLRLALAASALLPAACLACDQVWQLALVCGLLMGPVALSFPTLVRLKSCLVAEDEQGVAQGSTASIGKGSATLGLLFFGWLFRESTQAGRDLQDGLRAPFLTDSAAFGVALLVVFSLPLELPPTPQLADADGREHLMSDLASMSSSASSSDTE